MLPLSLISSFYLFGVCSTFIPLLRSFSSTYVSHVSFLHLNCSVFDYFLVGLVPLEETHVVPLGYGIYPLLRVVAPSFERHTRPFGPHPIECQGSQNAHGLDRKQ